jgi:hypothetical protein
MKYLMPDDFGKKILKYFEFLFVQGYQISNPIIENYGCYWYIITGKIVIIIGVDREKSVYLKVSNKNHGQAPGDGTFGIYPLIYMLSQKKTFLIGDDRLEEDQIYALQILSKELEKYFDQITEILIRKNGNRFFMEYSTYRQEMYKEYSIMMKKKAMSRKES